MTHENINSLLTLYFHEGMRHEEKRIQDHVDSCEACQDYLFTLEKVDKVLDTWKDEQPLLSTLDTILERIPQRQLKPATIRPALPFAPILQIAFAIGLVVTLITFVQSQIVSLSVWQTLQQHWFIQAVGSYGVATILFFCVGTFVTLTSIPVLMMDMQKTKILHRTRF